MGVKNPLVFFTSKKGGEDNGKLLEHILSHKVDSQPSTSRWIEILIKPQSSYHFKQIYFHIILVDAYRFAKDMDSL